MTDTVTISREDLQDALSGWQYIREHHGDLYGVGWDRVEQKLVDALQAPPLPSGLRGALEVTDAMVDAAISKWTECRCEACKRHARAALEAAIALSAPPPPSGLREALARVRTIVQDGISFDNIYRREIVRICDAALALALASPDDGWVKVDRIYLASRYSRFKEMQQCRDELEADGFNVTSRWINGGHQIDDAGLSVQAKEAERIRFAQEDRDDLLSADCIISFTEPPRSTNSRGGRHVEHGIALGRGKRTIVVGHRENVFHCLPEVEFYGSWAETKAALAYRRRSEQGG